MIFSDSLSGGNANPDTIWNEQLLTMPFGVLYGSLLIPSGKSGHKPSFSATESGKSNSGTSNSNALLTMAISLVFFFTPDAFYVYPDPNRHSLTSISV